MRERNEANNRVKYCKRQEIVYARTKADQRSWHPADTALIIKQLEKVEAMIVRLVNTGLVDIAARLEQMRRERKREEAETRLDEIRREGKQEEGEVRRGWEEEEED